MKSLEAYGTPLVKYEGVADLAFPEEPGIVYKGFFEARQLTTGKIAIGFLPISHDSGDSTTITGFPYSEPSFHGRDLDGWVITTCGQTLAAPIFGPLGAPRSPVHPAQVLSSQCINARREGATEVGYNKVHFLVSNLLWHDRSSLAEPISLRIGGLTITVAPIGDYLDVADTITAVRGIAPTAEVLIKTSDESTLSLERYGDFMNDLVSVFRLVTGNRVDWYYGEAFKVGTEVVVERFHKDAVTGPFSRTVRFRPPKSGWVYVAPKLDFQALAESFLSEDKKVLDRNTLKELINYFINACDETSYLEARGLLASTLLDLIVLKYARAKKADNIMEEEEFEGQVLPTLRKAIENASLPGPAKDLRARAFDQLRGAYRRSFRKRLELLTKELNLPLDKKALKRAVDIRNKLVHDGTYPSTKKSDQWYSQYEFIIWVDLMALCRLAGYGGDLPLLGRPLEV